MKETLQRFDTKSGFDKKDAQQALLVDGAIILTNIFPVDNDDWSKAGSTVPNHVWDPEELLLNRHRADAVHIEHERLNLSGSALVPHSDGYIWGDAYPDLVILLCEEPAANQGGANYLIDGYAVMERLSEDTKELLRKEPVDHTERGDNSFAQGAESIVPILRHLDPKGWRSIKDTKNLCWRRMCTKDALSYNPEENPEKPKPYMSLWAVTDRSSSVTAKSLQQAFVELERAIDAEEKAAPRFALRRGEALIVDNFRMLHSREAFPGSEQKRRMWRIWSWTNASFGLPPQVQVDAVLPSNILDAEHAIKSEVLDL